MKEGWEYKKICDCFSYIKNGANIKQEKNATGYPITRIETLSNGLFNRDRLGFANIFDLNKYQNYILNNKDILMSHINSKTYIGRAVVYDKEDHEIIICPFCGYRKLHSRNGLIIEYKPKTHCDDGNPYFDPYPIRYATPEERIEILKDYKED